MSEKKADERLQINLRLPQPLADDVVTAAREERRPVAQFCRNLVEDGMAKRGKGGE